MGRAVIAAGKGMSLCSGITVEILNNQGTPYICGLQQEVCKKMSSTQGQIFQLRPMGPSRPPPLHLLYVVRDSHAPGGKFPHLVVCFWILEFSH